MLSTYKKIRKAEKESIKVPSSIQQAIPINKVYDDGIFKVGNNFSKTWKFSDINYSVASIEDKKSMFFKYSDFINSLDNDVVTKITINNRRLNKEDFKDRILLQSSSDDLSKFRSEYNDMLLEKAAKSSNNMVQEKYITVSASKKNIIEARTLFSRATAKITAQMNRLSSRISELDIKERLRIFHDFYRLGEETYYNFDLKNTIKKGHDFRDYICPDSMEFDKNYIKIGEKYCRNFYIREFASFIEDDMITDIMDLQKNMMLSIDILPIPTDEAVKIIEKLILGAETDKARFTRKQSQNGNFTADIPFELEMRTSELKEFMHDMMSRNQRMLFATITIAIMSENLEELEDDTESLMSICREHLCQLQSATFQQMDTLYTVLPFGLHKLPYKWRTLTTESTAVFMPFNTMDIQDITGIYYGINTVSRNLIIADRRKLLNANGFILGVSGSGKSFKAKEEILSLILRGDVDVIVIDPEREYGNLFKAIGGEVIHVSAGSKNHINAMAMSKYYGDEEDPIILKSEFILSLVEQLIGTGKVNAKEKSLIDRCTANVYKDYISSDFKGTPPTLKEFRKELLKQSDPEAREIALAIELFTDGSLNTFAQQTNVNVDSQYLVYDIKDLGKQLRTIGMLVMLDSIFNRITENREKGRHTFLYIDEIYLLFQNEYSSNFLFELWKRVRKYGACATGITQNVSDLLISHTARTMLANSEFLLMMNQAPTDRIELANLINISETQLSHITDNDRAGIGLLKYAGSIVPFEDSFPRDTELYKLMTTTLGE
ncbi:MAG: VirB4-like conjugal transfer ATPase, CD1110 family [Eubacteriales bacterium]